MCSLDLNGFSCEVIFGFSKETIVVVTCFNAQYLNLITFILNWSLSHGAAPAVISKNDKEEGEKIKKWFATLS